jgi:O-antigen/teichoic acid export membrane protein
MSKTVKAASTLVSATLVSGVAAYLTTFLVFRFLGSEDYVLFAAFWASLFLLVGSLGGVQQELTRATRPISPSSQEKISPVLLFSLSTATLVAILVLATSGVWALDLFGDQWLFLVFPFAFGAALYVIVATLAGTLFGLSKWNFVALMIAIDGLLRLILLVTALQFTKDIAALAWCVILPFPLAIAIVWPIARKRVVGKSFIDVSIKNLTWNVSRTVLASISSSLIISGLPLLIVLVSEGDGLSYLGQLIFAVTVLRAPIIVIAISLQNYLVLRFRDTDRKNLRNPVLVQLAVAVLTTIAAIVVYLIGPEVLGLITGEPFILGRETMALIIISSGLVASIVVAGAAILSKRKHFFFSLGWMVSALATVLAIMEPGTLDERVLSAVLLGPLVGLLVTNGLLVLAARMKD